MYCPGPNIMQPKGETVRSRPEGGIKEPEGSIMWPWAVYIFPYTRPGSAYSHYFIEGPIFHSTSI